MRHGRITVDISLPVDVDVSRIPPGLRPAHEEASRRAAGFFDDDDGGGSGGGTVFRSIPDITRTIGDDSGAAPLVPPIAKVIVKDVTTLEGDLNTLLHTAETQHVDIDITMHLVDLGPDEDAHR